MRVLHHCLTISSGTVSFVLLSGCPGLGSSTDFYNVTSASASQLRQWVRNTGIWPAVQGLHAACKVGRIVRPIIDLGVDVLPVENVRADFGFP